MNVKLELLALHGIKEGAVLHALQNSKSARYSTRRSVPQEDQRRVSRCTAKRNGQTSFHWINAHSAEGLAIEGKLTAYPVFQAGVFGLQDGTNIWMKTSVKMR
jgi:hypothetical protein